MDRLGPKPYLVRIGKEELWRRHIDQLRDGVLEPSSENVSMESMSGATAVPSAHVPDAAASQE